MKRFVVSTTFTLLIILLYQMVDINLFSIDFQRRVSSALFKTLRTEPEVDMQIVLLDIQYVNLDTVKLYLQILESLEPRSIGVNLCNIRDKSSLLQEYLSHSKRIITCDCSINSNTGTARITTSKNEVTHFKSDKQTYFELQLAEKFDKLKERRNSEERINFREDDKYFRAPLGDIQNITPDIIKDKTVVVGFIRNSLVTPMNDLYGRSGNIKGDMSDVEISANIISTINKNEFINDVPVSFRILMILCVSLICTGLIRLVRTKYHIINITVAIVITIILIAISSSIIVIAFSKGYYLELNEMTIVLIVSAIISLYWNTEDERMTH